RLVQRCERERGHGDQVPRPRGHQLDRAQGRAAMIWRAIVLALSLGLLLIRPASAAPSVADLNEAGKAAYTRGDFVGAVGLFERALAEAPNDPLLHYHRGISLMRLSRWQEASAAFQTALRLDPPADVAAAARAGLRSIDPLLRRPPSGVRQP